MMLFGLLTVSILTTIDVEARTFHFQQDKKFPSPSRVEDLDELSPNNDADYWSKFPVKRQQITVEIARTPQACLYAHNKVRALHGEEKLEWDPFLAYEAERWAVFLAETKQFAHSQMKTYGENLFAQGGRTPSSCAVAVHGWYKEIFDYEYTSPGFSEASGHFTQLIWKDTRKVGVGIAFVKEAKYTIFVARYTPRGNTENNQFKSEVPPPLHGRHVPSIAALTVPGGDHPVISTVSLQKVDHICIDFADCAHYLRINSPCSDEWMAENCRKSCGYCSAGSPVNGGWTPWQPSSECSSSCKQEQERLCVNPFPLNGGKQCQGDKKRFVRCNTGKCRNPNEACNDLAEAKRCDKYSNNCYSGEYMKWMQRQCELTCGLCCGNVAPTKQCETYQSHCTGGQYKAWMDKKCRLTCGKCCGDVEPKHTCEANRQKGFCTGSKYKNWMLIYCKKTCGVCR